MFSRRSRRIQNVNKKLILHISEKYIHIKAPETVWSVGKNMKSGQLKTNEGERQGDGLSLLLLVSYLDKILNEVVKQANSLYVEYKRISLP